MQSGITTKSSENMKVAGVSRFLPCFWLYKILKVHWVLRVSKVSRIHSVIRFRFHRLRILAGIEGSKSFKGFSGSGLSTLLIFMVI